MNKIVLFIVHIAFIYPLFRVFRCVNSWSFIDPNLSNILPIYQILSQYFFIFVRLILLNVSLIKSIYIPIQFILHNLSIWKQIKMFLATGDDIQSRY